MNLLVVLSISVTCITVLYLYLKRKHRFFDRLNIPYVSPSLFLGNMGDAALQRRHISDIIQEVYNLNDKAKYVGYYDFMTPVILLRDMELMKSVAIKNFDHFMDHTSFVDENIDPLFGLNLFQLRGEKWKEARALLSPAFTSKKMKGMFDLMIECAENFVGHLDKMTASERQMVGTKDLFTKYTNDVIATCAFGLSIDSLENPRNQFYLYGREATTIEGLLSFKFFVARAFPNIMKFFRVKIVSDKIKDFFKDIIKTTIETRDAKGISRPDMLQLMMDARNNMSEHLKLDLEIMTAQCFIFFFGGFDTTSTQMCIIVHELASSPEIQKKLQAEIDEARTKCGGKWTYDIVNEMPYLDAVFNESLRRHPQVAFTERMCIKSFELPPALPGLKPHVIQPGECVFFPIYALHMDEQYFEEPREFKPERYMEKKSSSTSNMAWGMGPRSCIGNRFAILETKILMCYLLSKYNFKPNAKTRIPFEYSKSSFSIMPEGGYWVNMEKRA